MTSATFGAFLLLVTIPLQPEEPKEWATKAGAALAPEPFKSRSDWCSLGGYGDLLSDQRIVQGSERWVYLLCSEAALKALKEGDLRKACFLGSLAAGYLLRQASIATARVWRNDFSVLSRLPSRYWDVRAPAERAKEGKVRFFCSPPDWGREEFEKCKGEVRLFLEAVTKKFSPKEIELREIPPISQWSLYDAWLVSSWTAEVMAIEIMDLESVRKGKPKFGSEGKVKAILRSQRVLHAWLCAQHFSYLAEAANFEVEGLEALEGGLREFVSMGEPFIVLPPEAPPGVRRAAHVLATELREALRQEGKERPPLWRLLREEKGLDSLPSKSAVVVLLPPGSTLAGKLGLSLPKGRTGLVAFVKRGLPRNIKGAVVLLGEPKVWPHLLDFLVDKILCPLWGGELHEKVLRVLKAHWAGWKLIEPLEKKKGEEAVKFALNVPFKNLLEDVRAFKEEADEVQSRKMAGFWDAVLPLPAPGGEGRTWDFVKASFLQSRLLKEVGFGA